MVLFCGKCNSRSGVDYFLHLFWLSRDLVQTSKRLILHRRGSIMQALNGRGVELTRDQPVPVSCVSGRALEMIHMAWLVQ